MLFVDVIEFRCKSRTISKKFVNALFIGPPGPPVSLPPPLAPPAPPGGLDLPPLEPNTDGTLFSGIQFPIIKLPKLTSKTKEALVSQGGSRFARIWDALLTMRGTLPIDHGKYSKYMSVYSKNNESMLTDSGMTIILPTDQALEQEYPEPNIGDEDPFVSNMPLARQLVTDHIILQVDTLNEFLCNP